MGLVVQAALTALLTLAVTMAVVNRYLQAKVSNARFELHHMIWTTMPQAMAEKIVHRRLKSVF